MSTNATYAHPLIDSSQDGVLVSHTTASPVYFSAGRADLLVSAARRERRVVMTTPATSVLTDAMARSLRALGGAWAVLDDDGHARDGFSGLRLRAPEHAVRGASAGVDGIHPSHLTSLVGEESTRVRFIMTRRHRLSMETQLGADAETIAAAVAGAAPAGWGWHEPGGMPWDRIELTAIAREHNGPARLYLAGSRTGRALTGSVRTQLARDGLVETTELLIDLGAPGEDDTARRIAGAVDVVRRLERGMPLTIFAALDLGRSDLSREPRARPVPEPALFYLGPPAVRSMAIDAAEWAHRFGAVALGRRRLPSLLLDLTALPGPQRWHRLAALRDALGPERVAAASPGLEQRLFPQTHG